MATAKKKAPKVVQEAQVDEGVAAPVEDVRHEGDSHAARALNAMREAEKARDADQ